MPLPRKRPLASFCTLNLDSSAELRAGFRLSGIAFRVGPLAEVDSLEHILRLGDHSRSEGLRRRRRRAQATAEGVATGSGQFLSSSKCRIGRERNSAR